MLYLSKHPSTGDLDVWTLESDGYCIRIQVVSRKGKINLFADRIHYALLKPFITDKKDSIDDLLALVALESL